MENGVFRTDDLTLATVLSIRGYDYDLEKLTESKAIWLFKVGEEREEEFDELLGGYDEFELKTEPRQLVLKLAEMRSELYAFLPRRRRPGTPASI